VDSITNQGRHRSHRLSASALERALPSSSSFLVELPGSTPKEVAVAEIVLEVETPRLLARDSATGYVSVEVDSQGQPIMGEPVYDDAAGQQDKRGTCFRFSAVLRAPAVGQVTRLLIRVARAGPGRRRHLAMPCVTEQERLRVRIMAPQSQAIDDPVNSGLAAGTATLSVYVDTAGHVLDADID